MSWTTNSGGVVYDSGESVVLASASRTTTQTSADIKLLPYQGRVRGIVVVLDITVNAGGSGSVTVAINGKDPASGKYYNLLTSAAKTSVATTVLRVGPDLSNSANLIAQDYVPETIQIVVTANNSNPVTYSVGLVQVG